MARRSRDGCGAVRTRTRHRPSSGPCGATFPQGKVGGRLLAAPASFPIHLGPVLWEGWVPLIRQGLWPCHLPRRGRLPPAGAARLRLFETAPFAHLNVDSFVQACYNVLGSSEPGRCHKTVDGSAFPCLQGVQMLFRPLPCNGKGVAEMTTSELYEFCLVLISLAELIILIIQLNKKK